MPHLSKNKLNSKVQNELENQLADVLNNAGFSVRKKVFQELFTKTEKLMIAKRLGMVFMFSQDKTPYEVSQILKISPSTVARYQLALERGHLTSTITWVKKQNKMAPIFNLLVDLVGVVLKPKRLGRFTDDDF